MTQSYATISREPREHKNSLNTMSGTPSTNFISSISPVRHAKINQHIKDDANASFSMSTSQSIVTSTINEFQFRPELFANSNRLQESCI